MYHGMVSNVSTDCTKGIGEKVKQMTILVRKENALLAICHYVSYIACLFVHMEGKFQEMSSRTMLELC